MNKTCQECGEDKPVSEFYKDSKMRDGYRSNCKECHKAQELARWRVKNPPKRKTSSSADFQPKPRRGRDPEKKKASRRKYYLETSYGISIEEYDEMYEEQEGKCAICTDELLEVPHIDHCHASLVVRGLLCSRCNWGLGNFRDNVQYLKNAIAYLEENSVVL